MLIDEQLQYSLLLGEDIEFDTNVFIKIPTVEEAIFEENLDKYINIFTITTRELFQTSRDLEKLEKKYPSLWAIIKDDEADRQMGRLFDENETVSTVMMKAFSFWTGLHLDGDGGFFKHKNGKIIHIDSEWVIDYDVFRAFSSVIKVITHYVAPDLPPPITSDARHELWLNLLKGRRRDALKNMTSITDKILILSISGPSYIPISEIKNMSIYHFYSLFNALNHKEAYETTLAYHLSPKFETDSKSVKHWKEAFARSNNKNKIMR